MGFFRGSFFKKFSSDAKKNAASGSSWPKAAILDVIREQYSNVSHLEDKDNLSYYGVQDNDLKFAIVLVNSGVDAEEIIEVGFLAGFSGFSVTDETVEFINSNLHIGVSGKDENNNLILIAGVVATGPFNSPAFSMVLKAWSRDVMLTLYALSNGGALTSGFAAAQSQTARDFALNQAPTTVSRDDAIDGAGVSFKELSQHFLGRSKMQPCGSCNGRGKKGLIAKICDECGGTGFVEARGPKF